MSCESRRTVSTGTPPSLSSGMSLLTTWWSRSRKSFVTTLVWATRAVSVSSWLSTDHEMIVALPVTASAMASTAMATSASRPRVLRSRRLTTDPDGRSTRLPACPRIMAACPPSGSSGQHLVEAAGEELRVDLAWQHEAHHAVPIHQDRHGQAGHLEANAEGPGGGPVRVQVRREIEAEVPPEPLHDVGRLLVVDRDHGEPLRAMGLRGGVEEGQLLPAGNAPGRPERDQDRAAPKRTQAQV